MNELKVLQDIGAFLLHIAHSDNATSEQKQIALELDTRVNEKIAILVPDEDVTT